MNQTEANAALCRALGMEPIPPPNLRPHVSEFGKPCNLCKANWFDGFWASPCAENKIYPDLTSADRLMAALDSNGMGFSAGWAEVVVARQERTYWVTRALNEPHGHALFRAACAAFDIEYEVQG